MTAMSEAPDVALRHRTFEAMAQGDLTVLERSLARRLGICGLSPSTV